MAEQRKLAAILAADVAGFSRLTGDDEDRTLARLRALRSDLIDPTVAVHRGRVVKRTGDGALVEFRSVVDAVRCAVEVQTAMIERNAGLPPERRIEFRIGVHLGDVVEESDGDLMGDGVNIAARLEGLAEPGGICISDDAYRQVHGKVDVTFEDAGEQRLKNIAAPVRVYRGQIGTAPTKARPALALPDKPSIAVLAFQNMSGDPEQEYFADGMVEEMITALSRFSGLFVIARNSSFVYKGRAVDVKQIGRELGVRYVLEGSVRKAGNRVRITGQLVDTSTGAHLWADRFDGSLEDIFDLQDKITASVVGAMAPKLERAEIERSRRKPTESLDAYDHYLRGIAALQLWSREGTDEALAQLGRAIALDPNFATAHGVAARCYVLRRAGRWTKDYAWEMAEAVRRARCAVELGPDDAQALGMAGFALNDIASDFVGGDQLCDRALALNPNLATAWLFSGWSKVSLGEPDIAIERVARAMRLSPQDPQIVSMQNAIACAHFVAGRYDEASAWAEAAMLVRPDFVLQVCVAAASAGLIGRMEEAHKVMGRLRQIAPDLSLSNLKNDLPTFQRTEDFDRFADGLRRAGLPE